MELQELNLSNIRIETEGNIAIATLNREHKRNALDIDTIEQLIALFTTAPRAGISAVVLRANGDHFSAGLDLVEHHREQRTAADFMHVCLRWHEAFNKMEYSGVPVIAALKGAVVGAAASSLPLRRISASPTSRPISLCRKASAACSPAAAPPSALPTSSASRVWST